jgi:hypothetical protein
VIDCGNKDLPAENAEVAEMILMLNLYALCGEDFLKRTRPFSARRTLNSQALLAQHQQRTEREDTGHPVIMSDRLLRSGICSHPCGEAIRFSFGSMILVETVGCVFSQALRCGRIVRFQAI